MRRSAIVGLLATSVVVSGCTTREQPRNHTRDERHPTVVVVIACTEFTATLLLNVILHTAASALSR